MNKYLKGFPYVGNKHKQIEFLLLHFPKNIGNFYDLFCGGLSVPLNTQAQAYFCNDKNGPLIEMYKRLAHFKYDFLKKKIDLIIEKFQLDSKNKENYNKFVQYYNSMDNVYFRPIFLFILTSYSHNNYMCFNLKGQYNLPFGKRTFNKKQMKIKILQYGLELLKQDCN